MSKYQFIIETDTSVLDGISEAISNNDHDSKISYEYPEGTDLRKSLSFDGIIPIVPVIIQVTAHSLTIIHYIKTYLSSRPHSEKTKVAIRVGDKTLYIESYDTDAIIKIIEEFGRMKASGD